jgi:rfaE bifunctional protein kinase chain/domain
MSLANLIDSFSDLNILVIGDTMIDAYYIGTINRMSPEAPVPIVSFDKKDHRPGGAANVALNLKSMGANVTLCTVVGMDSEGAELKSLLEQENIITDGVFFDKSRPTTVKTRVIADEHHLLRMDHESTQPINLELEQQILNFIGNTIDEADAIIFEDYNKGLLTQTLITEIISLANSKNIPSIVDPKKDNFLAYTNCSLFKPNRKEIKEGLPTDLDLSITDNIEKAASQLIERLGCKSVMVTLSEDGVYIKSNTESIHIKAHERTITDVSGAGDTVVSLAALCLAKGLSLLELAEISNIGGGLVCQKVGVVPINKDELKEELNRLGL